ncbi:kinase suppressor of Ras 1-like isoform X1 [Hydractinia symbiolongicarpus]|uniref:kinase suppressor of Ras 1-like isoform X1 n=1 Tax=Hydractinia symbiolongicarpus TaxID=13093 RepID=UPI002549D618|nr:kinase suppressor of Ras 1-like isoform X1 [Hydractinia symbiolongicarpus]
MAVQPVDTLLEQLEILQRMIDVPAQSLKDLREKKESGSELINKEKNVLEGKLMKFFAKQIIAKLNFGPGIAEKELEVRNYPRLDQFLFVVDIEDNMVQEITTKCSSVEELCLFSDEKINGIFYNHNDDTDVGQRLEAQCKRLRMALKILRSYVEKLQSGGKTSDLHWSSWFDTVPESPSPNIRASIASYLSLFSYSPTSDDVLRQLFPLSLGGSIPPSPNPCRNALTIPRSNSEDANVGQKIHTESTSSGGSSGSSSRYHVKSSKKRKNNLVITLESETDSENSKSRSSSMSQSPRTPTGVGPFSTLRHEIKHRFSAKLLISVPCDYCNRIMFTGYKCKECGFKCHKKCKRKTPPSCGLPEKLLNHFQQVYHKEKLDGIHPMKRTNSEPGDIITSVNNHKVMNKNRSHDNLKSQTLNRYGAADSYSTTSSTSSRSSSSYHDYSPPGTPSKFDTQSEDNPTFTGHNGYHDMDLIDTFSSTASTVSTIKSELSTDTLILTESEKSKSSSDTKSTISCQDDCTCTIDDIHAQISDVVPQHVKLRDRGSLMSEWVIPFQDIEMGEMIGEGRVGKVYKAKWHGEVALKVLYLENPTVEEKNDFKYKVQNLRRTRHENLSLFMGACMEAPTLAIVCSFCKGYTLYTHIHVLGYKFDSSKLISIIQQIVQGMSYLHARGIVHNDLKTKNIFLENNKIVITDFGLISVADVKVVNSKRKNYLQIPQGWLGYQAPEIMRRLDARHPGQEVPFYTKETDIYAFGSVYFELLAGHFPFNGVPSEIVIYRIGKGFKQTLNGLQVPKEEKDILSMIWAFNPEKRLAFHTLFTAFDHLPKNTLKRSLTSQPITRSANALIL